MNNNDYEIPQNATIRQEYVKCGNPDCQNAHGPYLYAYWKKNKKLTKRYLGKTWEDFRTSKRAKCIHLTPTQYRKSKFIREEAVKGNPLAMQYAEKLRNGEVSLDWAYRVINNKIHEQRMLKMMTIADNRHFSHDDENDLVQFIATEMQNQGLDLLNDDDLESYLNTNLM